MTVSVIVPTSRMHLVVVVAAALLLTASVAVAAEPFPDACQGRLDCEIQRIADLKDHRDYLESQLALAKALVAELRQAVQVKDDELLACRSPKTTP